MAHAYPEDQLVKQPDIELFAVLGWTTVSASEGILAAKRADAGADTNAPEAEIDRHVYALYQPSPRLRPAGTLTPEEIKIVEEAGH